MTRILHLDASARPGRSGTHEHGSHSRRLTHRFVSRWLAARPQDAVTYRDVGAEPPTPVSGEWIEAAFASPEKYQPWMDDVLAESDALIDEVIGADVLVLGVPLYNFSMPSAFKAWIDNIVRVRRTVDFDPDNHDEPFTPLLADRPRKVILLSSRGGHQQDPGGRFAHMNHLESSVRTALDFIGLTDVQNTAIEYQEAGGELLAASIRAAEDWVDARVRELLRDHAPATADATA
ncbi:FMN-dependent NADH-azoreductase [Marinobacter bohaiensis]|uniref:FMN-dependent NADH-azoreductase n=1 Tax=Marinobacter bohaiensis TaxID=2201898 RepID=UPI000DAED2CF|nr:NAD(P)H-dependent oxidoreductase [Marinobacter bohaiensis]